jgi:hypothetical protein
MAGTQWTTERVRVAFGDATERATTFAQRPSLLGRLLAGVVITMVLFLVFGIMVLGAIVAIPLALGGAVYFAIKRGIARLRAPNGALDGRRNVKVIERRD